MVKYQHLQLILTIQLSATNDREQLGGAHT